MLEFKQCNAPLSTMLKQQSREQWVKSGDPNFAFFHVIVKHKNTHQRLFHCKMSTARAWLITNNEKAVVTHFKQFLHAQGYSRAYMGGHYIRIEVVSKEKR